MRTRRFDWEGAAETAEQIRIWTEGTTRRPTEEEIRNLAPELGAYDDARLLELTNRFDATEVPRDGIGVEAGAADEALAGLDADLRESLELAAANIRTVAEAQLPEVQRVSALPGGQSVALREVAVDAAGIYAPGGRAAYPSSVLMCAIPARVAGVRRVVLATPSRPDGTVAPLVLAAAALAEVDEIYAIGGAQAIFALARGSDSIDPVDVVAGPGNSWVREAKRMVSGEVGIDSLAGPSELMLFADASIDPEWAALDLCAQAEHGGDGSLVAVSTDPAVLDAVEAATVRAAGEREGVGNAPLALIHVPDVEAAVALANAFAPEHLELLVDAAPTLAEEVTTAGCVFAGACSATAFGDYIAGSNHVLPTGGAGRFSGPLGPHVFRRRIAVVQVPAEAAAKLAPHVDRIARAEGFPIHGESAMIRAKR
ncbi:MAG TPA: histidinol dehydrogenase [Solirubrobacterales bacterium]|nr:histidinol dehydrogenase [Solirubrobacterales bacterium]